MKKIAPMVRIFLAQNLIHREFWLALLLNQLIPVLLPLLVWRALFLSNGDMRLSIHEQELYRYYLASFFIFCLCSSGIHKDVSQFIHSGLFSNFLVKPMSEQWQLACMAIARILLLFIVATAITICLSRILGASSFLLRDIFYALPNIILGSVQMIIFSLAIGSLAFWFVQTEGIFSTIFLLMQFLGGVIIPLDFMPTTLWLLSSLSPLKYSIYYTAKFISSGDFSYLFLGLVGESVWIGLSLALLAILWSSGIKKYDAAGA